MHDPDVVAFEIRRPWTRRSKSYDAKPGKPRWKLDGPFWILAGRGFYWPTMVTIWHREPGGRDSGEVCKHYIRTRQPGGTYTTKIVHGWRLHVHHWRVQISPLQTLRRRALTRCAWCGGRHRKADPVNISHQWNGNRPPWWRGERGLFHAECSSIERAHHACVCTDPVLRYGNHGCCVICSKSRAYGEGTYRLEQYRILAAVPDGVRDRDAYRRTVKVYEQWKKQGAGT